jgi:hypothetical protein
VTAMHDAYVKICVDFLHAQQRGDKEEAAKYSAVATAFENAYPEIVEQVRAET